jgi:hypothetical protein
VFNDARLKPPLSDEGLRVTGSWFNGLTSAYRIEPRYLESHITQICTPS